MYNTCKRDNKVFDKLTEMISADNLTEEQKQTLKEVRSAYGCATFKEWDDRHEFYYNVIDGMINDCGFQDDELAEKLANNHPTLQQNFMRFCRKFIEKMSKKTYWDGRNVYSVQMAKTMMEAISEKQYLPFV